jgi:hypothetical protein
MKTQSKQEKLDSLNRWLKNTTGFPCRQPQQTRKITPYTRRQEKSETDRRQLKTGLNFKQEHFGPQGAR